MTYLLPVYARSDYSFEKGEGVYLYDSEGNKYLDFIAGIGVNCLGHAHPHMVDALKNQADKLWHVSNLYHISGAEKLAERLCKASGFADYVFFCNSGAEAVECGLKMIRKFQNEKGNPEKHRVITFEGAFHGRTLGTISAAKKEKLTKGFGPLLNSFDLVPFEDIEAVKAAITDETAGILIEPVQGEGGIRPCSNEFLRALREICDEHDLTLMFDGVQCGMGRTGKFFSHEWAGIHPDICSSAKGIGGGFPLGACFANKRVGDSMHAGSHGSTYAGGPLAIAVASAVMDVMLAEGFLDRVVKMGEYIFGKIEELKEKYPNFIEGTRGKGLMIGIKFNEINAGESKDIVSELRKEGLLTAAAAENVVRMLPPLIIEKSHADEAIEKLEKVLKKM